ncbi:unnamed protein product [Spirodela intermedia]|uniref:Uncharacterized protein n=1 Tax=Spirodela intermedia TaxID=51605 RepID=A0A7I8J9J8_SPIIN|nr:unnamed protein product [Spirodela intermedia]CAA6666750.1 unnamed protein product [Spirodela intermedia]
MANRSSISLPLLLVLFLSLLLPVPLPMAQYHQLYIVHMGEKHHEDPEIVTSLHHDTLSSILGSLPHRCWQPLTMPYMTAWTLSPYH